MVINYAIEDIIFPTKEEAINHLLNKVTFILNKIFNFLKCKNYRKN